MLNPCKLAGGVVLSAALASGLALTSAPAQAAVHPCGVKCKLTPNGRAALPKPLKIVVPPTFGGRA